MKKTTTLLLAIIIGSVLAAQQKIDSLRQLLSVAKADTSIIKLMNQIAHESIESTPDSALKYATEARRLARQINFEEGEISAIIQLANAFTVTGNYSKGLEYCLDALKKSEGISNQKLITSSLWALGGVYSSQNDEQQALIYFLKVLDIFNNRPFDSHYAGALINVGNTYFGLKKLDSSRYYWDRSLNVATQIKDYGALAASQMNIGRVYLRQNQYDTAIQYFRKAMPTFTGENNYLFVYYNSFFLAEAFDSTRRYDSAMYYSQLALQHAKIMNTLNFLSEVATQLSFLYRQAGQNDSAWFFINVAKSANDSVNSQANQKKIQTLTFNEHLRQMEIEDQKKKDAEARKRNLELSGIAIFIPLFLLGIMLIGRRNVKSRTIEFLGILGLLFLFEFIVLLVHPYIGHWTHESPIWMLLILVAIAAILVPLHHKSEAWIKKNLSKLEK